MLNITHSTPEESIIRFNVPVTQNDYAEKVSDVLKKYRKTADMPGFRKGKVPMGIIKKRYERAVIFDEVNKLVSENLQEYLKSNEIETLASPIPVTEDVNWEADDYNFEFDAAEKPEFEADLSKVKGVEKTTLTVDKKTIAQRVEALQAQYGSMATQDEVSEDSSFVLDVELEEEDKEGKTTKELFFRLQDFKKVYFKRFLGLKAGEEGKFPPAKAFADENSMNRVEGVKTTKDEIHFTVKEIKQMIPAELNEEFFAKIGGEECKTEADFHAFIEKQELDQIAQYTNTEFINSITEKLIENAKISIPDSYLNIYVKHQLMEQKQSSENPTEEVTDEEVSAQLEATRKAFMNQLMVDKLTKDNDIKIEYEEIEAMATSRVTAQFAMYGMPAEGEMFDKFKQQMLSNQENIQQLMDSVLQDKVFALYQEKVKFKEVQKDVETFYKELSEKNAK